MSAKDIIKKLSSKKQIDMLSGLDFWHLEAIEALGIPPLWITDGPHGLRKQVDPSSQLGLSDNVPSTCYPTAVNMAASWNDDLVGEIADALAQMCLQENVVVLLGPGINLKRSPLCGRNFEYFSEDPYLTARLAASYVKGLQARGVGACIKHYVANHQEKLRMVMNAIIDPIALTDLYLSAFKSTIEAAKPRLVMTSYNRVNGEYVSEHPVLLGELLRNKWQYDGVVVSDWGGINDRIASLHNGLDLEMPGNNGVRSPQIERAIQAGRVDDNKFKASLARNINLITTGAQVLKTVDRFEAARGHQLAIKAARESIVLLKNNDNLLPMRAESRLAVIGQFAKEPRFQGTGSSKITPTEVELTLQNLIDSGHFKSVDYAPGYQLHHDKVDQSAIDEACRLAARADYTVLCIGLPDEYESEGFDRDHLRLPDAHNALVDHVCRVTDHVIVVLSNGAPVEMPWHDQVPAIVEAYLSGQGGGRAISDILTGRTNPSGHLAESFPLKLEDYPTCIWQGDQPREVLYKESLFIGYRYFDRVDKPVLFPFGHGLSYTTFAIDELSVSQHNTTLDQPFDVSCVLTNTGGRTGKQVVQLYVKKTDSSWLRPVKTLRGYRKIELDAKQSAPCVFSLCRADFEVAIGLDEWAVESGEYHIEVGFSSTNIQASHPVVVDVAPTTYPESVPSNYRANSIDFDWSDRAFIDWAGGSRVRVQDVAQGFTMNNIVADVKRKWIGRMLLRVIKHNIYHNYPADERTTAKMMYTFFKEMPLRNLYLLNVNVIDHQVIGGFIDILNGHWFKGLPRVMRGAFSRRKRTT